MSKDNVQDTADALANLVDCTLATVERQSELKSVSKHDRSRQIAIAQRGVDWMREFGVDPSGTRAEKVIAHGGSVEDWTARR